jgi:hypothetical protein
MTIGLYLTGFMVSNQLPPLAPNSADSMLYQRTLRHQLHSIIEHEEP